MLRRLLEKQRAALEVLTIRKLEATAELANLKFDHLASLDLGGSKHADVAALVAMVSGQHNLERLVLDGVVQVRSPRYCLVIHLFD